MGKHRLLSALSKNQRKNKEYRKFVNCAAKFVYYAILGATPPKLDEYPRDCSRDRRSFLYLNYFMPVRMRKVYFKYEPSSGKPNLNDELRKNCEVCGAIEIFADT